MYSAADVTAPTTTSTSCASGTIALVFALLSLGLNVAVGFAGLLDLGYIAYYGVGAYGYAMLSSDKFGITGRRGSRSSSSSRSPPCSDARSPCRRVGSSGDYLAIVHALLRPDLLRLRHQGYRVSFLGLNNDLGFDRANWDLTGGPNGIADVDRFTRFGLTASSERAYFYVTLTASSSSSRAFPS
jgi:branched-chain amino acid transport system permease protein